MRSSLGDGEAVDDGSSGLDCSDELDLVLLEGHTILELNYRRLKAIPSRLLSDPQFANVKKLHMKRNLLKTLPDNLSNLSGLVELYLHTNEIQCLPEGIGELVYLQYLDVSSNQLTQLPEALGKLLNLNKLNVSNNRLKKLPSSIGHLMQLETLECMNNELTALPLELCNCQRLSTLNLDINRLQLLPRQICRLHSLRELSVVSNNLLVLPNGLDRLVSLQSLNVDNNPYLCTMPAGLSSGNVKMGYHNCGLNEPTEEMKNSFCHVVIRHSETEDRSILLPSEIKMAGTGENTVLPLLELCMRTFNKSFQNFSRNNCEEAVEIEEVLPSNIQPLLEVPTSRCQVCKQDIFVAGFPIIFNANRMASVNSTYLLALCCTKQCLKPCFFSFNFPLVYPTTDVLNLAVARAM